MPKRSSKVRFFLTSSRGLLNHFLRLYLKEKFGIEAVFLPMSKVRLRRQDVILHNGNLPLRGMDSSSFRLVVFRSEWNEEERLFWQKKGAAHFLCLSEPLSEISKIIRFYLKTKV
jgi:hypothetical protein